MPPRYWWGKRILLAVGVFVVLLVVLRWWWGWEAQRRLDALIAAYRAAGQPVTLEDFQQPTPLREENGALFLQDAAAAIAMPTDVWVDLGEICQDLGVVEEYTEDVAKLVAANGTVLELVREARSKPQTDWGLRMQSPVVNVLLPDLSSQRQLARFLCVAALQQHHEGDDAEAAETIADVLNAGERIGATPFVISDLVMIGIEVMAVNVVEEVAPTLRVGGTSGETGESARPVGRERLQELVLDLLDDEPMKDCWRRGMYGERLICLDAVGLISSGRANLGTFTSGGWLPAPLAVALRPMLISDGVFMLEYDTALAAAGAAADYPTMQRCAPRYPAFESAFERNKHFLSRVMLPSLDRALEVHFLGIARRHMAATALAIRLFEVEHGRRPASLDELVPEYLPALPADPFTAGGRPLGYLPDAPQPILYSVGADGEDNGGHWALNGAGEVDRDSKDEVFFLNGDRPRARPAGLFAQLPTPHVESEDGDEVSDNGQDDEDGAAGEKP